MSGGVLSAPRLGFRLELRNPILGNIMGSVNRGRAPSKPTTGTVRCSLAAGGDSLERARLLKARIPCYTGNLQGILSVSAFAPDLEVEKEQNSQWLANKFLRTGTGN